MKKTHTTSVSVYAVATALAISLGGIAFWYTTRPPAGDDPVFSRKVLDYREIPTQEGDVAIQYSYQGEPLPERLEQNEIPQLRTTSSYVVEVEVPTKEKRTYEGKFFSQEAFVQENGVWYYKESATTTTTAFNALKQRTPFANLFIPKAHADTASPYSGSGDGEVVSTESGWSATHDASGSNATVSYLSQSMQVLVFRYSSGNYRISRIFLPFDTSSIPAAAVITSASLHIRAQGAASISDNDSHDYLTVVQTSQATHTQLVGQDFDQAGSITSPTEGVDSGNRVDSSAIAGAGYISFTLNSTGRGWVKKSGQSSSCSATLGVTCLGLREGHDTTNTTYDGVADSGNNYEFYASERTGTDQDPYLSVTYTIPTAFWQWMDF